MANAFVRSRQFESHSSANLLMHNACTCDPQQMTLICY